MLAGLPRPRSVNRQSQCVASTVGMDPPGPRPHNEKHGSPVPSCRICVEHKVTWTAGLVTGRGQHRHTRAGASAEHGMDTPEHVGVPPSQVRTCSSLTLGPMWHISGTWGGMGLAPKAVCWAPALLLSSGCHPDLASERGTIVVLQGLVPQG